MTRGKKTLPTQGNLTDEKNRGNIRLSGDDQMLSIQNPIEQRNTGKGNPNAMEHFGRPLNNRQQRLDDALPGYDSRIVVKKRDVNLRDLAALTAKTNAEYSLFTRKGDRMIVRGNETRVNITPEIAHDMTTHGWRWSGHTHPGIDVNVTTPSPGDYAV